MDLNRVILIGRMASDPELKYTPSGIPVSQFRLAVNRPMSAEARQNGQEKQADFFSIVAWRQSAEYAANYLGKGRLVAIEGRLQVREYVTQDGQKRRDTEIVVDNLKSLDRPKDENGGYAESGGNGAARSGGYSRGGGSTEEFHDEPAAAAPPPPARPAAPRAEAAPARRPANAAPANNRYQAPVPEDDMDDPFADN
jgi:single-strand DNA-binding protein